MTQPSGRRASRRRARPTAASGRAARAVVVHDLAQAEAALAAAAALEAPLMLVSAEGASATLGPLLFRALVEQARRAHPEVALEVLFDCAEQPGHAAAALRAGFTKVRFGGRRRAAEALVAIAAATGAELVARRPKALDLRGEPDPEAACRAWLARGRRAIAGGGAS